MVLSSWIVPEQPEALVQIVCLLGTLRLHAARPSFSATYMNDLLRSSLALSEPTVEKMRAFLVLGFLCIWPVCLSYYTEDHREQFHYSQAKGWMNDPNGLIFYKGVYHMFYQHNPLNNTFGPIHWGHTITRDLVHWEEQQLAIFPDKLGYIFSGSAVIDYNNTAGFGTPGNPAMVAIFAQHNQPLEDQGKSL